jgi:hypothetical protein
MIKDIYDALVGPKMTVQRQDWDNLSDDVCYINPDPDVQHRAEDHIRERQKKEEDMSDIEKVAWKSASHCSRVCEDEDVEDEDEWLAKQKVVPRVSTDPEKDAATAQDTEKAEDSGPSDAAAREQWHKTMSERKKNRTCFQWRWHDEQCCTARSFKMGAPKAKPEKSDNSKDKWVSGWDLKGINDWIDAMGECKVAWKTPEL